MAHFLLTKTLYCSCPPLNIAQARRDDECKCSIVLLWDSIARAPYETLLNDCERVDIANSSQVIDTCMAIRAIRV